MRKESEIERVELAAVGEWEILTEDSFALVWDFDWGDGKPENFVASASRVLDDGWRLTVQLRRVDGRVIPRYLFDPPDGPDGQWPTTRKLKELSPEMHEALEADVYSTEAKTYFPASWFDTFDIVPRPGRSRRKDRAYAVWARRYVEACEVSDHPVPYLAEKYGMTESQVNSRLTAASRKDILVRQQGRVGGVLTDYGKHLIEGMKD